MPAGRQHAPTPNVDLAGRSVDRWRSTAPRVGARDRPRERHARLHFSVPVPKISATTKRALERVAAPATHAGLDVEFSGGVISTGSGMQSSTEFVGFFVALVALLVTFGALLPAILPLLTAAIGVAIGALGITALSGFITLSSTAPVLATMLGLAAPRRAARQPRRRRTSSQRSAPAPTQSANATGSRRWSLARPR